MEGVVATQARVRAGGWCSVGGPPLPSAPYRLLLPSCPTSRLLPPSVLTQVEMSFSGSTQVLSYPQKKGGQDGGGSRYRLHQEMQVRGQDPWACGGRNPRCGRGTHLVSVWGAAMTGPIAPAFPVQVGVLAPPASSAGARVPLVSAHGPRESSRVLTAVDDRRWLLVKPLSTTVFYKAFYKLLLYFLTFR